MPPSTRMDAPLTKLAMSEARNTITAAHSSGSPVQRSGVGCKPSINELEVVGEVEAVELLQCLPAGSQAGVGVEEGVEAGPVSVVVVDVVDHEPLELVLVPDDGAVEQIAAQLSLVSFLAQFPARSV